jgi:RNA-directed DNA polymerase
MSGDVPVRFCESAGVRFPRATLLVICCHGTAEEAQSVMAEMMQRLRLTVNGTKTKRCRLPEENFNFLGYTFGRYYSGRTGGAYLGARPAVKKVRELCASITEQTSRRYLPLDPLLLVGRLNRQLRGWANYFCYGANPAVRLVDRHVARRLRRWLCRKHKVPNGGFTRFPDQYLTDQLGLVRLQTLAATSRVRTRETILSPRAGCGKTARPVR